MKLKLEEIPKMTIEEFADKHDLVMEVHERKRPIGSPDRYYAHFERCEVMQNGCLAGVYGNGATPEAAIADYATRLQLTRVAINAMSENRREIEVPRLVSNDKGERP